MNAIAKTCLSPLLLCLVVTGALLTPSLPIPGLTIQADPKEIDRLIEQLGSEEYAQREAATKALLDTGEPALQPLRRAATDHKDPEIRRRAEQLIPAILRQSRRRPRPQPFQVKRYEGPEAVVSSMAFSPDLRRVFCASTDSVPGVDGSVDHTLRLWELESGKQLLCFKGHAGRVRDVAFSPDGLSALSCGFDVEDKDVVLWNLLTGKEIQRFRGHGALVHSAAFSPDGKLILIGCGNSEIGLWDVKGGKKVLAFERGDGHGQTFFPDGSRVLAPGPGMAISVYESATGKRLRQFGENWVYPNLTLSPDGSLALIRGTKRSHGQTTSGVEIWEVDRCSLRYCLQGHKEVVICAAFSPDSSRALTACRDGEIRLWDVKTGTELRFFRSHTPIVLCVAFTPDGQFALSGHPDNTVVKWALPK